MDFLQENLRVLLNRRTFVTKTFAVKECDVEEESDMYGFSLISNDKPHRARDSPPEKILSRLMKDQNWNNPGSVCLMCRAYHINNTYESIAFGQALNSTCSTYLTIKTQQHKMLAEKYFSEGMIAKGKGLFIESVKAFSDSLLYNVHHTDARIERADSYYRQNKKTEAISDYLAILNVQPQHTLALERIALLRNNTSFSPPRSTPTSSRIQLIENINNPAPQSFPSSLTATDVVNKNVHAKPLVYKNQGLIGKLQQSLLDNPHYLDTSNSSDDSSDSEVSSHNSEKQSSKKRKHKSSKSAKEKRSKSDKSSKKRKSKHKKDKHSKKHKSDK